MLITVFVCLLLNLNNVLQKKKKGDLFSLLCSAARLNVTTLAMQVLNDEMFTILVLMVLFTTFITTPIVLAIYNTHVMLITNFVFVDCHNRHVL